MSYTLIELGAGHGFTAGDLNANGDLAVIPAFQKIYFADGRTKADGGFHKLDFLNTRLVGTPGVAFVRGEILTQAGTGAKGVFDETVTVGAEDWNLVFRTTTTQFDTTDITGSIAGTLTPTDVVVPPHWFDWVETAGLEGFPDGGADIGCLCFGRIFLNDMFHPNQWKASEVGNPLDWLIGQEDTLGVATPISSQNSQFGIVGSEITAMIPYKDQFLIFGGVGTIDILRGDPAAGGQISNVVTGVGIFGPKAWTWDGAGNLYFVDLTGFYRLPIGSAVNNEPPENLTMNKLPELFKNLKLSRLTDRVNLSYDFDRHRVLVNISLKDGTWQSNWFYDVRTGGIFPQNFSDETLPASVAYINHSNSDLRRQYLGGYDGYIRVFDESSKNDAAGESNEIAINSSVLVGPIELSLTIEGNGEANQILLTLSEDTDGVGYEVYTANTAEKCIDDANAGTNPLATGTFSSGGAQNVINVSVLARYLMIKLTNTNVDESWGFESLRLSVTVRS